MKTPLAWLNLVHQKRRTLVATAGVSFAIILIFMQLGFRGSAESTATVVYDRLDDFELVIISSSYRDMNRTGTFPRSRLSPAMGIDSVDHAYPIYFSFNLWRNPESGIRRSIFVIGINPTQRIFAGFPELNDPRTLEELNRPDTIFVDRMSHPDFGLIDGVLPEPYHDVEIGTHRVEIVGQFKLGTGFASDGSVITSDETFTRLIPGTTLDRISMGLVKLKQGADVLAAKNAIRSVLPEDVTVLTRDELESMERDYWLNAKSIGILFTCGVLVAFLVGVIFVYQIISTDITNHLSEYATLKAMGYGEGYLSKVVLQQAVILGALSYIPGLLISLGLYEVTRKYARVPIDMNMIRALSVLAMALLMCSLSGLFSLQKVRTADPADLF